MKNEVNPAPVGVIEFCDRYVTLNEKGKPWSLSKHQRKVLSLAFRFNSLAKLLYRLILWSEPKKSGKTFVARMCVDLVGDNARLYRDYRRR